MRVSSKEIIVFVVVGRLGKSLTVSKVVPFMAHPLVDRAIIFREEKGFYVQGAEYITLDSFFSMYGQGLIKKIIRFFAEPVQLIRYARRQKPFLINGVFTLPKGLNAVIASKLSGTKSVVSVIGGTVEISTRLPGKWFWKRLNLQILKHCDVVTTKGSRVTSWLIKEGISPEKIFNLNGSIDAKRFIPAKNVKRDIDILFVGNFSELKGPDRVLAVIKHLVDQGLEINAVFLGDGKMLPFIEKDIKRKDLKSNVTLKGYVDDPVRYFQKAKMLLMPSMSEGLPTAMLEAMACGCVPIVSDVGNITDAAEHNENSLVIKEWDDIRSFADAAHLLISDDKFREQLSSKCRDTILENYTPEKQALVVEEILQFLNQKA